MAVAAIFDNFEWPYLRNGSQSTYIACGHLCDSTAFLLTVFCTGSENLWFALSLCHWEHVQSYSVVYMHAVAEKFNCLLVHMFVKLWLHFEDWKITSKLPYIEISWALRAVNNKHSNSDGLQQLWLGQLYCYCSWVSTVDLQRPGSNC